MKVALVFAGLVILTMGVLVVGTFLVPREDLEPTGWRE